MQVGNSSLGNSEPFGQAQTLLPVPLWDSADLLFPRWVFLLQPPRPPTPADSSFPAWTQATTILLLCPLGGVRGKEPLGGQHRPLLWRGDKPGTPEEVATPD